MTRVAIIGGGIGGLTAANALSRAGISTDKHDLAYVKAALDTAKAKVKQFTEVRTFTDFYFIEDIQYDAATFAADFPPTNLPHLKPLREALAKLEPFDTNALNNSVKGVAAQTGASISMLVHPLRVACTGRAIGPSLYHLLEVLGKEKALARMDRALGAF